MKLNLGSGQNPQPGYVNVDRFGTPDVRHDLEVFPWPWETSSVEAVRLCHVLEHLGQSTAVYLQVIQELYRICQPGAQVMVTVPHPRHDDFLNDPTHVRPITPEGLALFSKAQNRAWAEAGASNSPLGLQLDVDFEVVHTNITLEEPWRAQLHAGKISQAEVMLALQLHNNVASQMTIELRVVK